MNKFSTQQGFVTISQPFFTLIHDQRQVTVTYTPNNFSGWGICKDYNANEIVDFTQADAELFASNADSKLRLPGYAA